MPRPRSHPAQATPDEVRRDIEQALVELRELTASDLEPASFYATFLTRVARVLDAPGAAVWIAGSGGALHLLRHEGLGQALRGNHRAAIDNERHRLVEWLAAKNPPPGLPPATPHVDGTTFASRISPAGGLWGLVTVYLQGVVDPAAALGMQRFVDAAAALATEYQARRELRHWDQDRDALSRLHDLTMAVHRPWSLGEVLAETANEGRRFLGADRVAVAVRRGGSYRVVAASGAASLNRRSAELQELEKLTTAAMRLGQAFFYEESPAERPPQIEQPLGQYLEQSATRRLAIIPLDAADQDSPSQGALVVEQMSDRPLDSSSQSLWLLVDHAAVAVDRATRLRRLPLLGPALGVASLRRTVTRRWAPRGLIATAVLGALVAALLLIQTDYRVRVTGELVPAVQRHVFAPADGIVTELHATHGANVSASDDLAQLKSPELERERTRLLGAIATAEQELAAAEANRLEGASGGAYSPSPGELAAQKLLIEQRLKTLREEHQQLEAEFEKLRVRSPIAGRITTWGMRESLAARPVMRGERLCTVADLSGAWRVRFFAADRQAGPILETHRNAQQGVRVRFVTAARPELEHEVRATRFRLANEQNTVTGENQLRFEADFQADPSMELRPGAEVVGQVECGRRSLAYAWLGGLYEEFRRRFF